MVGTAVFGAPQFLAKTLENTAFFHKKMQNRGAPKTAVPTTTHPIPQLTTSLLLGRGSLLWRQDLAILSPEGSHNSTFPQLRVFLLGGGGYMREIGAMWQLGVLAGKLRTSLGPKWVIFGVLALQLRSRLPGKEPKTP